MEPGSDPVQAEDAVGCPPHQHDAEGPDHQALDLDMGRAALRVFEHAIAAGQGDDDMSAVVEQFRIQAQSAK